MATNSPPMLACGCRANARNNTRGGAAWCAIHDCGEIVTAPNLSGRVARCGCGRERPSTDPNLAFFEYRGPGSPSAEDTCRCGYARVAHEGKSLPRWVNCTGFKSRGDLPDIYYCGCRGWD